MTHPTFVPTADPIEPVGYTPDPDNPELWPPRLSDRERPFDWKPEIPLPGFKGPLKFCRLNLRQGCYQLFLDPTGGVTFFQDRFAGTMRVEIGHGATTVSGDLYSVRRFDDLVFEQPRAMAARPVPIIPIRRRNRYFSYLRVVRIETPVLTQFFFPCTMTLTVEEFRYSPPVAGQATGSFPQTASRVLTIVLTRATTPAGFQGPSFVGDVFEGGTPIGFRATLHWVSEFFRRARLELENVVGVAIPGSVGADSFQSTYAKAGWDVSVVNGDANLAAPSGVGAQNPWSQAELHAFMVANRSPASNLDVEWQMYHVSVPFDSTPAGLFGLMFDQIGDEREGACNFIDNFEDVHDDDRARLRSAIHEVGHGFNQLHPSGEGLASDNSIMSQSGDVRTVITAAGGTYPDDINFAFNDHDRHHLIHAPDVVVRPGGEDFTFGHIGTFFPEADDNASDRQVQLRVRASDDRLKLGQPLVLTVEIVNNGKSAISVPALFGTAFHNVDVVIHKQGSDERAVRSFVILCHAQERQAIRPGQSIAWEEVIYWDRNGVVFPDPGSYHVTARATWFDETVPLAASASVAIWVDFPLSEKDNAIAAILLDDEVGKYVALGGNAVHLRNAVARIAQAKKIEAAHPAVRRIARIDEIWKQRKTRSPSKTRSLSKKRSPSKKRSSK